MIQKPSIPKGTRDFRPQEVVKRNYLKNIIQKQFTNFGFLPIETPSLENLSVLTGKYGEEGDRLIFKILNSGDYLKKTSNNELQSRNLKEILPKISDKALRYDLTIPFARYVVQHQNEIQFPFKRYQIQPVWRADRPQKGRYREFHQCDADVIGSKSLWSEVELLLLYDAVFHELKLDVQIHINNRKILLGLAETAGISKFTEFTNALDKLDKIGPEKVQEEMTNKGIAQKALEKLMAIFYPSNSFEEQIQKIKPIVSKSTIGMEGIEEVEFIQQQIKTIGLKQSELIFDSSLARGLDYYTGTIVEIKSKNTKSGSIGGGGRYDDLTGVFGLKNLSGVGISFGLDRIYNALEEQNLFSNTTNNNLDVLFLNLGQDYAAASFKLLQELRENGIKSSLYPDAVKMKKQFNYANNIQTKFVAIIGEKEFDNQNITIKNMNSGEQTVIGAKNAIQYLINQIKKQS